MTNDPGELPYPAREDPSSDWWFPPPMNATFLRRFNSQDTPRNITKDPGNSQAARFPQVEYAQNVTLPGVASFGNKEALVHVGDVLDIDWKISPESGVPNDNGERSISIKCVVCTTGTLGDESPFDACDHYRFTAHVVESYDTTPMQPPRSSFTIPTLSRELHLPDWSVGLCYLMLSTFESAHSFDWSIPFPVTQETRYPHYRFSSLGPRGIPDSSILNTTSEVTSAETSSNGNGDLKAGDIVGIVLGVVAGILLSAGLAFWCWRRERNKKRKRVDTPSVEVARVGNAGEQGQNVELQRVERGGVERRVDRDDYGEVPPAYHEVVRKDRVYVAESTQI